MKLTYLQKLRLRNVQEVELPAVAPLLEQDEVLSMLYKSDRSLSDSSLSRIMLGSSRPELAQHVSNVLLHSPNVNSYEDADVCLEQIIPHSLQYGAEKNFAVERFAEYVHKLKNVE